MNTKIRHLERIYLILAVIIAGLIIFTPMIINQGVSIFQEDVLEGIVIALLLGVGYLVIKFYRLESKKNIEAYKNLKDEKSILEERLLDAFKYIGSVNIQIDEIKGALSDINKYPMNKQDIKYILQFMGKRVLSMTDADWVLFRIIDTNKKSVLREYCETRGNAAVIKVDKFSNKNLLENNISDGYKIVKSAQENFSIKTFCVINSKSLNKDQEILIKAIVNQLEMLFLIFTSYYYKTAGKIFKN